ncbi:hypothetical protein VTI74DRAFT_11276 [Chaetomium olivicolor]
MKKNNRNKGIDATGTISSSAANASGMTPMATPVIVPQTTHSPTAAPSSEAWMAGTSGIAMRTSDIAVDASGATVTDLHPLLVNPDRTDGQMKRTPLSRLPNELLLRVVKSLSGRDLLHLAMTNRNTSYLFLDALYRRPAPQPEVYIVNNNGNGDDNGNANDNVTVAADGNQLIDAATANPASPATRPIDPRSNLELAFTHALALRLARPLAHVQRLATPWFLREHSHMLHDSLWNAVRQRETWWVETLLQRFSTTRALQVDRIVMRTALGCMAYQRRVGGVCYMAMVRVLWAFAEKERTQREKRERMARMISGPAWETEEARGPMEGLLEEIIMLGKYKCELHDCEGEERVCFLDMMRLARKRGMLDFKGVTKHMLQRWLKELPADVRIMAEFQIARAEGSPLFWD